LTLSREGLALRYWLLDEMQDWHPAHNRYARAAYEAWQAGKPGPADSIVVYNCEGVLTLLDDKNALRVRFELEHGEVVMFVVQLECLFMDSQWIPVVRYDTAHGFAHCDRMHPHKDVEKTEMRVRDFNEGLTVAMFDLTINWSEYRRRYEEWLVK